MDSERPRSAQASPTSSESPLSPRPQHLSSSPKRKSISKPTTSASRKRIKLSSTAETPIHTQQQTQTPQSRKGRACTACRKLKVKCDAAERGIVGCSRCQRLGIECINVRSLRVAVEGEDGQTHPTIRKIERALEDVLQKLHMPGLDSYARASDQDVLVPQRITSGFMTRDNSRDPPVDEERGMAPAPMGSLYEVTQLRDLKSRLPVSHSRRAHGRRQIETDIISQGVISAEDAEELLALFKTSLTRYLYNTTIPETATLYSIRESSSILLTAILLVSALHIPGKEAVHKLCHDHLQALVSQVMFSPTPSLDDIRGLCIAAFWQPDLSWKLSGLCIRLATELNLHHAFYRCFYTAGLSSAQSKFYFDCARLWYLLYVLDHHFSIAYGRPPVTAELLPIRETQIFLKSQYATAADHRLISQVSLFITLSRAYDTFGTEPDRTLSADQATLMTHDRFTESTTIWRDTWKSLLVRDPYIGDYPAKGALLHHGFAQLVLNSLALRGRSLDSLETLPQSLRPLALHAVQAAHFILQYVMEEPAYRESLVGIPLYLHSMIAFAAVFLSKLAHRWHLIGIDYDPDGQTRPLLEGIVRVLRDCKAGREHMVYSMASGFERLLQNWGRAVDMNAHARPRGGGTNRGGEETERGSGNGRLLLPRPNPALHIRPNTGITSTSPLTPSLTDSSLHAAHEHQQQRQQYYPNSNPISSHQTHEQRYIVNHTHNQSHTHTHTHEPLSTLTPEDPFTSPWAFGATYDLLAPNAIEFDIDLDGFGGEEVEVDRREGEDHGRLGVD